MHLMIKIQPLPESIPQMVPQYWEFNWNERSSFGKEESTNILIFGANGRKNAQEAKKILGSQFINERRKSGYVE